MDDWGHLGVGILGTWQEAKPDTDASQVQLHVQVSQHQQGETKAWIPAHCEPGRGYPERGAIHPGARCKGRAEKGSVMQGVY